MEKEEQEQEMKNPAATGTAGKKTNYASIFWKWFIIGFFTRAVISFLAHIL